MKARRRVAGALAVLAAAGIATVASAHQNPALSDAGTANTKTPGISSPDKLSPQLRETTVAQGSNALENPSAAIGYYGYYSDGPMVPAPGSVQSVGHNVEATKSEPDKNTYLVVPGQHGADPAYDYGTHFLYQGHELAGPSGGSFISRINLDADAAHRVTKLAEFEADGTTPVPEIDGSTWDPFAQRLLFTTEGGPSGGVVEATLDYPSTVTPLWGILGQGGFEGIQNDSAGNIYIVEDSGGPAGTVNTHAKQPGSFLYRFLPYDAANLDQGGKLQVLQVASLAHPGPIVFHPGQADADILSQDVADEHTYGKTFSTTWITIHDTAVSGTATAFDANALAKAAGGTPFKRPENGQFQPDTNFKTFFFDETGDTNSLTEAGAAHGGFGSIMKLTQNPRKNAGTLQLFYLLGRGALELRQRDVLRQDARDLRPGHGRRAARADQLARLRVPLRRERRLRPRRAARQGDRRRPRPRPRPSTPRSERSAAASRTRATTSSRGSTCRTAIPPRTACSATTPRGPSRTAGGCSSRTSTATT